ncbi:MAG TPA: hypothetical protein VFE62_25545 [Gemmataceae bacterium]|nr:hypothetical protein [Gemmataceae bacterium]
MDRPLGFRPDPSAFCVLLLAILVIYIFFLLTLQKALKRVAPSNRLMEPGAVWIMFVPCVNIVWGFVVAVRVPDSLKNEFQHRGLDEGGDYGKTVALIAWTVNMAGGIITNIVRRAGDLQPFGGFLTLGLSLTALGCFIAFWVKVANYSRRLAANDETRDADLERRLKVFDDDRYPPKGDAGGPASDAIKEGDPEPPGTL